MRTYSRCKKCSSKSKKIPYGAKKTTSYLSCLVCDCGAVVEVNKKGTRRKAKQAIRKEIDSEEK